MTEVGEHFVFLSAKAHDLSGSRLLTRPVGLSIGGRDVLVALDSSNEKHLLIPISGTTGVDDHSSRGVTLGLRILRVGGLDLAFADMHCRIPQLDLVFERLIEDVLARLANTRDDPVGTCRRALDDWRALLRAAAEPIPREKIVGLIGELETMRHLAMHDPLAALDAWRGPTGCVHDFVRGRSEIEVKATTAISGNVVSVSNIDQLDPHLSEALHLIVVHLRASESAPTLDERIDSLIAAGVPRGELLTRVEQAGYVYESGADIDDRFEIRSIRAWHVDHAFPGLRRNEIGEERLSGVEKIRYELLLDSAPNCLDINEFERLIVRFVGAA